MVLFVFYLILAPIYIVRTIKKEKNLPETKIYRNDFENRYTRDISAENFLDEEEGNSNFNNEKSEIKRYSFDISW